MSRAAVTTRILNDPSKGALVWGTTAEMTRRNLVLRGTALQLRDRQRANNIDEFARADDVPRATFDEADAITSTGARASEFPSLAPGEDEVEPLLLND